MRKVTIPSSIRYAVRSLSKSWGFAALFVLTLTLGLSGVNTIFSVLNTVILRPLPFKHADRIVTITETVPFMGSGPQICTLDEFERWQKSGLLLVYAAAINTIDLTLTAGDRAELLSGAKVTPDFFRVFGISPLLGRNFRQEDSVPGHEQVIILSHELWARRFGSDPAIIGKSIQFSGTTMTVIGVAPPRFDFPRLADVGAVMRFAPEQTEFWAPLVITQKMIDQNNYSYYVLGRLHAGIPAARAAAEFKVSAIQSLHYVVERNPQYREPLEHLAQIIAIQVTPLNQSMAWGVRNALWMLVAAVSLLLLLVLFNLGNLLVTRNANRLREYAIRQALGGSRWQLFRQALIELGILIVFASILSLVLSGWAIELVRAIGGARVPRLYELSVDTHTVLLLIGLAVATALVFGALPLVVLPDSIGWFRSESRSATGNRRSQRLRASLIAAEIAVSMVLLVGAGLLAASFLNVMNVDPGFDPKNLLTFSVSFSPKLYADPPKMLTTQRELLDRIRTLPGVESASIVNVLPLTGDYAIHGIGAVGKPLNRDAGAEARLIDPRYFETMHIPLIAGRALREDDSGKVALINQKMASLLWPGENPIGREFTDNGNPPIRVIGVVGNVHSGALETQPMMQYYSSFVAFPGYANSFAVRTKTDPLRLLPSAERRIWDLDPDLAVSGAKTMEQIIQSTTLERRFETDLLLGFSASALFLSALGLFGVASLSARRHSREFGIRMALGATGGDVLRLEMSRNAVIIVAGLAVGLLLSFATHRAFTAFLFGVSALNPNVYAAAVAVLTISTLTAVLIPALRASRIDPAIVLRDE
jgi:putative ABC transport system permease protein